MDSADSNLYIAICLYYFSPLPDKAGNNFLCPQD